MRAVVQRVDWARVEVAGATVGSIGRGLLVLLAAGKGDGDADGAYMLKKLLGLRVFPNELGRMDKSVVDVAGSLLVVSQFTLYGDVQRGLRPSFDASMEPAEAERRIDAFVAEARRVVPVETGRFRANMTVTSSNDGPVTLVIDSERGKD